ncbi:hypothetical protein AMTRI_Chr05g60100 [Amborella trichopoda]
MPYENFGSKSTYMRSHSMPVRPRDSTVSVRLQTQFLPQVCYHTCPSTCKVHRCQFTQVWLLSCKNVPPPIFFFFRFMMALDLVHMRDHSSKWSMGHQSSVVK